MRAPSASCSRRGLLFCGGRPHICWLMPSPSAVFRRDSIGGRCLPTRAEICRCEKRCSEDETLSGAEPVLAGRFGIARRKVVPDFMRIACEHFVAAARLRYN